jgi:hypothetical protein
VCGCKDGTVIFYSLKKRKQIKIPHKQKLAVEDMQWNPGEDYLLVAYKDGSMKLFEMDHEEERFVFERQGAGINNFSFINFRH